MAHTPDIPMQLDEFLSTAHTLIEARLHALVPQHSQFPYAPLFEAARYSLFSGGKRLRPLLTLASALSCRGTMLKALDLACAIECIHTYSLIHDDLPCMDNDDMRRGKLTLHRKYPEWHALLTGDFLLTHAFEILAKCPDLNDSEKVSCMGILAHQSSAHGMIGGQMIDLIAQEIDINKTLLEQMHAHKTAALFSAALECGAISAGASWDDRIIMRECGIKFGIAFQIADDILDADPQSSDQKQQKITAVSLLGYREATYYKQTLLSEALDKLKQLSYPTACLTSLLQSVMV